VIWIQHALPTARTTLQASYVALRLTCRSCLRSRNADLQALVDAGNGDVPLVQLRFRCSYCGHRNVDVLVVPKERVLGPRGWSH
jgi:hypothetical protein